MFPRQINADVSKWEPRPGALNEIKEIVKSRSCVYHLRECVDLPPITYKTVYFDMPRKMAKYYTQMERECLVDLGDKEVIADNVLVKLMKLSQITGGFLMDEDGEPIKLEYETKLDLCKDWVWKITSSGKKVIIWARFRCEIEALMGAFENSVAVYGKIPYKQQQENIARFKTDPKCQICIMQPQSGSRGHTLVVANFAIYYSMSYNYEEYHQSNRRIERIGQILKQYIIHLTARRSVDQIMLYAVKRKRDLEQEFLTVREYQQLKQEE